MPDLAAVAKAIREADEAHYLGFPRDSVGYLQPWRCMCSAPLPDAQGIRAHRYTAMARAAADALGVSGG
jgi:hypothetical protein